MGLELLLIGGLGVAMGITKLRDNVSMTTSGADSWRRAILFYYLTGSNDEHDGLTGLFFSVSGWINSYSDSYIDNPNYIIIFWSNRNPARSYIRSLNCNEGNLVTINEGDFSSFVFCIKYWLYVFITHITAILVEKETWHSPSFVTCWTWQPLYMFDDWCICLILLLAC